MLASVRKKREVVFEDSRITARRFLEYLADAGVATRTPRYGGVGRPETEHRWR